MLTFLLLVVSTQIWSIKSNVNNEDPPPPVWPNAFSVGSKESWFVIENNTKIPYGVNPAYWYYDYTNLRMRFDHEDGQVDNFCWYNVHKPVQCSLFFASTGAMYAYYPTENFCCRLCDIGEFCSVLKPNWMADGSYNGKQIIENRTCNVWNEAGSIAMDYWAQDDNDVPCEYFEDMNLTIHGTNDTVQFWHQLTFHANTYIVAKPDESIFAIPDICHKKCNNTPNFTALSIDHMVSALEY